MIKGKENIDSMIEGKENTDSTEDVSFGSLLLQTISRGKEEPKQKRKRIGIGAEVITTKEYIERKKKEIEERDKKIKIKEEKDKGAKKVSKTNLKEQRAKKIQRKISVTTSESDIMSIHSDSDILDAGSDSESVLCQETDYQPEKFTHTLTVHADINIEPKPRLQKTFDTKSDIKRINHQPLTNEEILNAVEYTDENSNDLILKVKDTVLVRYYEKKKWKYYVGTVQRVEKNDRYKVLYYKHFVQNNVVNFSLPKKHDIDVVPITDVVKKIELVQSKDNPNIFILFDDQNDVYFL